MDQLDHNLFAAWSRIARAVQQDRVQAARRAARQSRALTRYIMRSWCLCLRASDTRLLQHAAFAELLPDDVISMDDDVHELIHRGRPHIITLHGEHIRELTKPVPLPWPGINHRIASRRLGITTRTMQHWIKAGSLTATREDATIHRQRGKRVPRVYSNAPLDPNGFLGRPPDSLWGSLWQSHYTKLPEAYELVVERRPRTRLWRDEEKLRGWNFICPGRYVKLPSGDSRLAPCGRLVRRLYFPLPLWTIPQACDERLQLATGNDGSRWSPGFDDPLKGGRSFACKHCWQVRSITLTDVNGWNEFITHLTGGLLLGHEVERPTDIVPYRRKHRFTPRPRQESIDLRERVVPLLLDGMTYKQIAATLNITHGSVVHHIHTIYRDTGVSSRKQLRETVEFDRRHAEIREDAMQGQVHEDF